jgi:hypothetical protein
LVLFVYSTKPARSFQSIFSPRTQTESGTDETGRPTNGAGVDLGEAVWSALGMKDNGQVEWEFIQ